MAKSSPQKVFFFLTDDFPAPHIIHALRHSFFLNAECVCSSCELLFVFEYEWWRYFGYTDIFGGKIKSTLWVFIFLVKGTTTVLILCYLALILKKYLISTAYLLL